MSTGLKEIVEKLRTVSYGDMLLPDDHNLLVEAFKALYKPKTVTIDRRTITMQPKEKRLFFTIDCKGVVILLFEGDGDPNAKYTVGDDVVYGYEEVFVIQFVETSLDCYIENPLSKTRDVETGTITVYLSNQCTINIKV